MASLLGSKSLCLLWRYSFVSLLGHLIYLMFTTFVSHSEDLADVPPIWKSLVIIVPPNPFP